MNALQYAITMIKQQIPAEILQAAFTYDENQTTLNLTSLEEKILRKCIRQRVMLDANVIGGTELIIPLNQVAPAYYEDLYTLYYIPPELTMEREIVSALSLTALPISMGYNNPVTMGGGFGTPNGMGANTLGPSNALMSVANRIGDAAAVGGVFHNAHLEIVAYNTVAIYAYFRTLAYVGLRVLLENDSNMNNIQPRSYRNFGMLCVLAVKAYIYNKLSIPISSGYLTGGQELGMIKNIIDGYSSSEEDYQNYLQNIWGKVAFMNDTTRHARFLGSMIAPDL